MTQEILETIEPSHIEKRLLLETDRAQRMLKVYIERLDVEISELQRKLEAVKSEKDILVAEGNSSYDESISSILKLYGVESAQIDFNASNGPVINVLKKFEILEKSSSTEDFAIGPEIEIEDCK